VGGKAGRFAYFRSSLESMPNDRGYLLEQNETIASRSEGTADFLAINQSLDAGFKLLLQKAVEFSDV
jgi:hypothetical protein